MSTPTTGRRVAMLTLGCARNEVDSEELAGRLTESGWQLVDGEGAVGDPDGEDGDGERDRSPDVILVNTCGFVESAKKDSVDTLLAAADSAEGSETKVVAVGCMAQRYGTELAESLPEASAVLGFDHYANLPDRLDDIVAGRPVTSHTPQDRRTLLPITPVERQPAAEQEAVPGHGWGPRTLRRRLGESPVAPLKIASGCDRRCAFCAIPSFRGSFVSRPPSEVVAEARWLAEHGARELYLVSENSTSYGKDLPSDLGGGRALELLLPALAEVPGIERVRVSYLQPAETRPELLAAIATTQGVAPYFDLSFQHGSSQVLRRMRRFGGADAFLGLCTQIREFAPSAGIRTNVIVGFPGETEADLEELERFLTGARLDAVGVFGYSDEDGTEGADLPDHVDDEEIARRVERISALAEELTVQRAEERVGEQVRVLVERCASEDADGAGRAEHQAPEVDGECVFTDPTGLAVGDLVLADVTASEGVDLLVRPLEVLSRAAGSLDSP